MAELKGFVHHISMEQVGGVGRGRKIACHVFFMDAKGQPVRDGDAYTDDPQIEGALLCALGRPVLGNEGEKLEVLANVEIAGADRILTRVDVYRRNP